MAVHEVLCYTEVSHSAGQNLKQNLNVKPTVYIV